MCLIANTNTLGDSLTRLYSLSVRLLCVQISPSMERGDDLESQLHLDEEDDGDEDEEELVPLPADGQSSSWLKAKKNMNRILQETGLLKGVELHAASKWTLCHVDFWGRVAKYLIEHYVQPAGSKRPGQPLRATNVINYIRSMMHMAHGCLRQDDLQVASFFSCLDPRSSTHAAQWYTGLKKNIIRTIYERDAEKGELNIDGSETPIYGEVVEAICLAYARADTGVAAERKFAVSTLWGIAGRTGEAGFMTWTEHTAWDQFYQCVVLTVWQKKVCVTPLSLVMTNLSPVDKHVFDIDNFVTDINVFADDNIVHNSIVSSNDTIVFDINVLVDDTYVK